MLELGANDGLHMSNSFFFESQLGWRSLCIEANPDVYRELTANRPGCINMQALVVVELVLNLVMWLGVLGCMKGCVTIIILEDLVQEQARRPVV